MFNNILLVYLVY